jgi:hypothetical protein
VLEVFLQLMIVGTGNYAWINFLGMLPCISLLDDQFLEQMWGWIQLVFGAVFAPLRYGVGMAWSKLGVREEGCEGNSGNAKTETISSGDNINNNNTDATTNSGKTPPVNGAQTERIAMRGGSDQVKNDNLGYLFRTTIYFAKHSYLGIYRLIAIVIFFFIVYMSVQNVCNRKIIIANINNLILNN